MHTVAGLERPREHFAVGGPAAIAVADQRDALDVNSVDLGREFQSGIAGAANFAHVAERSVLKQLERRRQIPRAQQLAELRHVDYR